MLKLIFVSFLFTSLASAAAPRMTNASPTKPALQYIGSISINPSQDAKVLADWYTKFGIELQLAGGVYFGALDTAAGPFYFAVHPKRANAPAVSSGSVAVVFRVNDYAGYFAKLEANGIKPTSVEADETGHFAHYRDPDGNEITIWGD